MKPFIVLIILALAALAGCIGGVESTPSSELRSAARMAPSGTQAIGYINVEKALADEDVAKAIDLPENADKLAIFVKSATVVVPSKESGPVIAAEVFAIDLLFGPAAFLLIQASGAESEKYLGYSIISFGEQMSYFTKGNKAHIGGPLSLKKSIEAMESGSSAIGAFDTMIMMLPQGDAMGVSIGEPGTGSPSFAFSVRFAKGREDITIVLDFGSDQMARAAEIVLSGSGLEDAQLNYAKASGKYLSLSLYAEADKLPSLMSGNSSIFSIPEPPAGQAYPSEEVEEYCAMNPEECKELYESLLRGS